MTVSIVIETDAALPALRALLGSLTDLTELHRAMAWRGENLLREYLRRISKVRHATAFRLGATPTRILEKAAESPEGRGSATGATITIRPGAVLARAFGDVEIRPQAGKKYLTIPVAAEAYGRRAREIPGLVFMQVGFRKTPVLARRGANGNMVTYYVLVEKVRQRQDRTLLPDDETILAEMEAAAGDVLVGAYEAGT